MRELSDYQKSFHSSRLSRRASQNPPAKSNPSNNSRSAEPGDSRKNFISLLRDRRVIILVSVLILVIATILFLFNLQRSPVKLANITTSNTTNSSQGEITTQSQFSPQEPVFLHFDFSSADTGVAIKIELKNSKDQVLRTTTTTILRPRSTDPAAGSRDIIIANGVTNNFTAGDYTLTLTARSHFLGEIKFSVK